MKGLGGLFMSERQIEVFHVVSQFREGKLSRKEAARKLGLSERTVQRKSKRVRESGAKGITHGNKYSRPANQKAEMFREHAVLLYKAKYYDFSMYHAWEELTANHGLSVSYATFRRWLHAQGIGVKYRKKRRPKKRIARERAANEGIMLQLDGSPHQWIPGQVWTLIAMIDDATGNVPFAAFFPSETTEGCMIVLRTVIEEKGVPERLLTDRAGWSVGSAKRENFSQFARACLELDIELIGTSSPESKGRIERFNRTAQSRLVPAFRLAKIRTIEAANRYLKEHFLPEFNRKWEVEPLFPTTRYRQQQNSFCLDDIFCFKSTRKVNRDSTVHFNNRRYRILDERYLNLAGKEVHIHQSFEGNISIFYGDSKLKIDELKIPKRRWVC